MAKLKAIVENLDDVPEGLQELYTEEKDKDGNVRFVLNLDDNVKDHPLVAALARAHERQKTDNKELKTKLEEAEKKVAPDDFDANEWERLKEVDKELKELKDKGGLDEDGKRAHEAEIASYKKTHEQELARVKKAMDDAVAERDETIKSLTERVHKMVVEDGLIALLSAAGIKAEAIPFVQAKLERSVKVEDNDAGDPVMMFETDLGPVPASEYIPKWAQSDEAKPFVEEAKGGDALGGNRGGHITDTNPWSQAHWNMTQQAAILQKDAGKADRLAKAAGHKKAPGALRMDAK